MSNITSCFLHSPALHCSLHHSSLRSKRSSKTMINVRLRLEKCNLTPNDLNDIHITSRSAEYQPNAWNYDFLESIQTHDFKVKYEVQREKMIREVKEMLKDTSMDTLSRLELVDAIDRLGLKRHFQEELNTCVKTVYMNSKRQFKYAEEFHATALWFRILRQHGYAISEDIFNKFKEQQGNIRQEYSEDIRGLLSLYEASFLECRGDDTLEEIRAFAAQHLKDELSKLTRKQAEEVEQALDLPLHWMFPRLKARWSIDQAYDDDHHQLLHPSLITLAKLDYNIVQSGYKGEIKRLVSWWKELELPRKLPYSRDRLMESYLWTVGIVEEPEYHNYRIMETKVISLISALDDTYDVYGTLEELKILTDLINRWDIKGIDQLPEPMRHCFLAIYNTSNEIADLTLKEKGFHIIPYLRKSWARLSKKYLQEAKWYHEGYKPNLREYLHNGIVTIGSHLMGLDCYFLTTSSISKEAIDYINNLPSLLCYGATIIRLSNDLATSSDELARGDTLKALECYMNESGASGKVAREHINGMIKETWKKMNEEYYLRLCNAQYPPTMSEPFLGANLNLARSSQFFYSFKKDWYDKPDKEMMDHMSLLLISPIPMSSINLSD